MTRINTVPPRALTDQHLLGEYNEIRRPIGLALKRYSKENNRIHRGIPNQYQLRAGHVIFFYNKLQYIIDRFEAIKSEMRARGWSANGVIDAEIPDELKGNWQPDSNSNQILKDRLIERIEQDPKGLAKWRYYGKSIDESYIKTLQQAPSWTQ